MSRVLVRRVGRRWDATGALRANCYMANLLTCSTVDCWATFLSFPMASAACATDGGVRAVFCHMTNVVAVVAHHALWVVLGDFYYCHIILDYLRECWGVKGDDRPICLANPLHIEYFSLLAAQPFPDVFIRLVGFNFYYSTCRIGTVVGVLDHDRDRADVSVEPSLYGCSFSYSLSMFVVVHRDVYAVTGYIVSVGSYF